MKLITSFIFLLVLIYLFMFNVENFTNYVYQENIDLPIFNSINNNPESKKLSILINELSKIPNFSEKKVIELTSPKLTLSNNNKIWGIFNTLDIHNALDQLYFKKDMNISEAYSGGIYPLKLKTDMDKELLTQSQIDSLIKYVDKNDTIDNILKYKQQMTPLIDLCIDKINKYINNKFTENNINITVNQLKKNILLELTLEKLKIILKIIKNIPINMCDSIDLINRIKNIKKLNQQKYDKCKETLQSFINYQYKLADINETHLTNYTLSELKNIYNIFKYLNISNVKCDKLTQDSKFLNREKTKYHNNLVKKIEGHVSRSKNKNCYSKIKNHVNHNLDLNKIPKYYLGNKIKNYSEENLEIIDEIYSNVPECNYFVKDDIINKIININNYISIQGGHGFGCKPQINKFREIEFKQNNLPLPIPKVKSDYEKYNLKQLNKILELYENTPSCYQLFNNEITLFDDKINNYLKKIKDIKTDYNFDINNIIDTSNDILNLNMHPYYHKSKLTTNNIKNKNNTNIIEEPLDLEHSNFTFNDITNQSLLNKSYSSDLFKDNNKKIIDTNKLEKKIKYLERKVKNCCNKNNSSTGIIQEKNKGYSSAFRPEIIIETDKNIKKII
jgi:hypothetical protein